jgi:hypothetical protein
LDPINIVLLKLKYSPKLWVFKSIGERGLALCFQNRERRKTVVFVSQALEYFGLENELPILDLILVCATLFCGCTV